MHDTVDRYIEQLKTVVVHHSRLRQPGMTRTDMYAFLYRLCAEPDTFVPVESREKVITILLNTWFRFDVLQSVMEDPLVTDVHVIGTTTLVQRNGRKFEVPDAHFASEFSLGEFIDRQLDGTPYLYSQSDPLTDAILRGGYRMNVVGGPGTRYTIRDDEGRIVTVPRTIVSIRKPIYPFNLDDLVSLGLLNADTRAFVRLMMQLGDSFIVSGGVGSGKTTLMNAMTGDIPNGQLNLIIEELPEMAPLCEWAIRLTDRAENHEGKGRIDMARNLINSLRMNADNEYIGEVRYADIAYLFLRMSLIVRRQTGTTFHSHVGLHSGVEGVLTRFLLEAADGAKSRASYLNMAGMMGDKIRFVFTLRDTRFGKRITEIGEILGFDFTERALRWQPIMTYDATTDTFHFHGVTDAMRERAGVEGIEVTLPRNQEAVRLYRIAS
ncbi:ATPase, T2SS/T4P/T4SS family [Alicyclobacillus sp. ALC3]|uniref:ATPase, T2SS/T4P/T4SS family n=1 Tax=Alicyclobacillus sp. ALC3 TaxID=2796143 RepID=UPI0023787A61|nr:ATPase, T2SS/T4P/T4SS family [Alicyclobacillus sp. ALC3]WDL96492.1 CpaF family protein [Alicyclobacillus sp. ALC3]